MTSVPVTWRWDLILRPLMFMDLFGDTPDLMSSTLMEARFNMTVSQSLTAVVPPHTPQSPHDQPVVSFMVCDNILIIEPQWWVNAVEINVSSLWTRLRALNQGLWFEICIQYFSFVWMFCTPCCPCDWQLCKKLSELYYIEFDECIWSCVHCIVALVIFELSWKRCIKSGEKTWKSIIWFCKCKTTTANKQRDVKLWLAGMLKAAFISRFVGFCQY